MSGKEMKERIDGVMNTINQTPSREKASVIARRMSAELIRRAEKLNRIAEWVDYQPEFVDEMVWEMLIRDDNR